MHWRDFKELAYPAPRWRIKCRSCLSVNDMSVYHETKLYFIVIIRATDLEACFGISINRCQLAINVVFHVDEAYMVTAQI